MGDMVKDEVRKSPCEFCPYRKDVPSGVWHENEYAKLVDYDKPTGEQPHAPFGCHEATGLLCSGWAQCHGGELLALRLASCMSGKEITIPTTTVPLFASGREAAEHGMREVRKPGRKAREAIAKLHGKRRRRSLTKNRPRASVARESTQQHQLGGITSTTSKTARGRNTRERGAKSSRDS